MKTKLLVLLVAGLSFAIACSLTAIGISTYELLEGRRVAFNVTLILISVLFVAMNVERLYDLRKLRRRSARTELTMLRSRYGGTHVHYVHHHDGCALDRGRGDCNCSPIRTSDFVTPREAS